MALALTSFGSVDSLHPCSSPCGPTRYARVSKSAVLPICRAPNLLPVDLSAPGHQFPRDFPDLVLWLLGKDSFLRECCVNREAA
jgi:hypothetical protein